MNHIEELMTAEEVAKYLRLNKYTVYRMVLEKRLPAIKLGGRLRFNRMVLDNWIRKNSSNP